MARTSPALGPSQFRGAIPVSGGVEGMSQVGSEDRQTQAALNQVHLSTFWSVCCGLSSRQLDSQAAIQSAVWCRTWRVPAVPEAPFWSR